MFLSLKMAYFNNAKSLYPSRIITPYFDKNFKMYDDSIEGTVPRKIRIRTYNTKIFFFKENFKKEKNFT